MSALTEKEVEACKQAQQFISTYSCLFAEQIAHGVKPSVAHHEAVVAAQNEFPIED